MKFEVIKKNYAFGIILALIFLLCVVWPIPRLIGLRNALIGLATVLVFVLGFKQRCWFEGIPKKPLMIILALTAWIVLGIFAWGDRPAHSFRDFLGHWVLPLLCGFLGLRIAKIATAFSCAPERLVTIVCSGLLSCIVLNNALLVAYWMHMGEIVIRQAPAMYLPDMYYSVRNGESIFSAFNGTTLQQLSYTNNILAAILVAEVVQRIVLKRRFVLFENNFIIFAFGMILFCSYSVAARNGSVGLLGLLLFSSAFILMRLREKISKKMLYSLAIVTCMTISSIGIFQYKTDPRWRGVPESISLALSSYASSAWIKGDEYYPRLSNGNAVEGSAYQRTSYIIEGISQIVARPFGTGFNRNAFGYGVDEKYHLGGAKLGIHAHSGIVDFSIANGILATVMWLYFSWTLISAGWRTFLVKQKDTADNIMPGLMLVFVVSGFTLRSLVDSVFQGYEIEQFMFLVSLFYALSFRQQKAPNMV